jgi:hypothetical protein
LAYVFGRDEQYWYRLENRLGRNSVVGTTVKNADKLIVSSSLDIWWQSHLYSHL